MQEKCSNTSIRMSNSERDFSMRKCLAISEYFDTLTTYSNLIIKRRNDSYFKANPYLSIEARLGHAQRQIRMTV